jgi:hypothetical protein
MKRTVLRLSAAMALLQATAFQPATAFGQGTTFTYPVRPDIDSNPATKAALLRSSKPTSRCSQRGFIAQFRHEHPCKRRFIPNGWAVVIGWKQTSSGKIRTTKAPNENTD